MYTAPEFDAEFTSCPGDPTAITYLSFDRLKEWPKRSPDAPSLGLTILCSKKYDERGKTDAGIVLENEEMRRSVARKDGSLLRERLEGKNDAVKGKWCFISARKTKTPPVLGP
jgi:hypothetical protein